MGEMGRARAPWCCQGKKSCPWWLPRTRCPLSLLCSAGESGREGSIALLRLMGRLALDQLLPSAPWGMDLAFGFVLYQVVLPRHRWIS